jgi:hypothetical protein
MIIETTVLCDVMPCNLEDQVRGTCCLVLFIYSLFNDTVSRDVMYSRRIIMNSNVEESCRCYFVLLFYHLPGVTE